MRVELLIIQLLNNQYFSYVELKISLKSVSYLKINRNANHSTNTNKVVFNEITLYIERFNI